MPIRQLLAALLFFVLLPLKVQAEGDIIRIGVLSHRGYDATLSNWSPTADYLTENIAKYRFRIVPLDFDEVEDAVRTGQVDFLLVNPGIYVNMEVKYRVSRIATLRNRLGGVAYNIFGGVIFARRDKTGLNTLEDLKGAHFIAVDRTSLGGFQMAWRELKAASMDPYRDFSSLSFGGTHDHVVLSVLKGEADAGTVRTDILERMAAAGTIRMQDVRIINRQKTPNFPFAHSTRLYPEWPFSKVAHTSNALAQQVAVALLNMPVDHEAALKGNYAGWTIPLDYQQVHELFKELHLPPYEDLGKFTLADAIQQYWHWLLLSAAFLLFMVFMTLWVMRLNAELKRANIRLERQYELILNSVADGIYGVDLNGNSTFVNRAMERITGWTEKDLIGKNQHLILHHTKADGTRHSGDECPVYQTFRDNIPRFVADDVFWCKDGSHIPVEYSSTPIKDENGHTVGSVVVFRDITARKRAEEEARQHQKELAHVARLSTMGEMASGMAHELNQPLTAINTNARACIRMIESGKDMQDACADVMERIATQADRAGEIIRQLRAFVRKEEPDRKRVDLNELVRDIAVLIEPEARREHVQIALQLKKTPIHVTAQRIQIEQVILNLARNAIEAMTEVPSYRRHLTIQSSTHDEGFASVTVIDTGPGLNDTVRDTLFNPFVTTKTQGMGLGLSISQGIIEAHGGALHADNRKGGGAVFSFSLPQAEAAIANDTKQQKRTTI